MVFSNNLLMGAAGQSTGYEIENSLRLDGTGDMSRTVASDGNLRTWTISFWLKRSTFGTNGGLGFNVGGTFVNASNRSIFRFHSSLSGGDDDWYWAERSGGAWREDQATTIMYRDPSAWSHYVCVWDTDGGTTPRARRYVNGVSVDSELKSGGTVAAANVDSGTNQAGTFQLFDQAGFPGREFEGYCAETHFVDGTALGPTSFGEYNNDGVWIPKAYSGSYGTNGFYLDFADSSDLGKDVSGNGNDFTSSGLATTDQMSDTPTNNFCTMNPLDAPTGSITLSNGNLDLNQSSFNKVRGTIAFDVQDDDGFYFEVKKTNGNFRSAGIVATDASNFASAQSLLSVNPSVVYYMEGGEVNQNGSQILASLPTFATNDVLGVAVRNGKVYFAKNNTWVNSGDPVNETGQVASITGSSPLYSPAVGEQDNRSGITNTVNFGATAFAYTPPTGFKALSTANLATPTIKDGSKYFQPTLYNGTGSELEVDQTGNSTFQPDFAWIKNRTNAGNEHDLYDAVRGATKAIFSSTTGTESTQTQGLKSFDSDGFTVGTRGEVNTSGSTNVAWQWLANNTTGSTNDDGSVDSTVAVNTTAGFSIVKWVHTTSANYTVGHGLGATPKMILVKTLDQGTNWGVYHSDITVGNRLILNTTAAQGTGYWGANTWNSTVFSIGSVRDANSSNAIAYVFAEIPGYSSIGGYTGNGSTDGTFVYTGFKPAFVILKRTNATQEWQMYDTQRDPYNVANHKLEPNSNNAESILTGDNNLDFLSNGFKLRQANGGMNASGSTYIYIAFAEHPFGGDGAAPATAR